MGKLVMIAAAAENGALGKDNALLWHLPDDFKRFKRLTTGHPIIMGRKTFESFPRPLPHLHHLIITRDPSYQIPHRDCSIVHSLKEAIEKVEGPGTAYIIGGGEIYRQSMEVADTIELTRVHGQFEADTFFPEIPAEQWRLEWEEFHPKDERHAYAFTYQTYRRVSD